MCETNMGRDVMDLTLLSFIYLLATFIAYEMKSHNYAFLVEYAPVFTKFYLLTTSLRVFWCFKVGKSWLFSPYDYKKVAVNNCKFVHYSGYDKQARQNATS
jgi:hypothetical protein